MSSASPATQARRSPQKIEIVDIFRCPNQVPPVVDAAIRANAKVIWMQLGIANESAAEKPAPPESQ